MAHQKTAQIDPDTGALVDRLERKTFQDDFTVGVPQTSANVGVDASLNWIAGGTNQVSLTTPTHSTGGGLKLLTAGADNDQVIVLPHDDASQSAVNDINWGTDDEPSFHICVETDTSVAGMQIQAGFSLTSVMDETTDAHAAMFTYNTDTSGESTWQANYSSTAAGDVQIDTGVTVAASSKYHLKVTVGADRIPRYYVSDANGAYSSMKLVATGAALTTAINLVPYFGIQDLAGAAKTLYVRSCNGGAKDTN
jgi:hypothetical protein